MTPDHFPAALRTQLQPILQGPPQPNPDRPIYQGQFWHLSPTLQQHPARTIYEILSSQEPNGQHHARPWFPMNPHSHLNPVPGDTYYWTPSAHTRPSQPARPSVSPTSRPQPHGKSYSANQASTRTNPAASSDASSLSSTRTLPCRPANAQPRWPPQT